MFGGGSVNAFKPKYGKNKGFLPLPATFNRMKQRQNLTYIIVATLLIWFFFNPLAKLGNLFSYNHAKANYPAPHPFTSKHTLETTSRYIYPLIEDGSLLRELTVHSLIKESTVRDANFPEIEKKVIRSLNEWDDPNPILQKAKEDEENAKSELTRAKNYFKNQDKRVFRPKTLKNYPEVVVVTAVNFEKYSVDALAKIVQNRVDYGHKQNYGVYVRWYQEFLPMLNSLSYLENKDKSKWIRILCMRAAMFAFPHTKWFWYLDQDGLIMDLSINIQDYMLNPEALDPIMKREEPIIPPDGAIKTYRNTKPQSVKLVLTQSNEKIETHSFLLKNDHIGKSILEFWTDDLYLTYPSFPYGPDSALTHILQWHPFVLSKTSIVPPKTISAVHPIQKIDNPDAFTYKDGDFVVQWGDCTIPYECEKILNTYHKKLTEKA